MKRYNLSAEFVRWEVHARLADQMDSFDYVVEVQSEEEAYFRLEALIVERMSSKPGWAYRLIRSGISEFSGGDQSSLSLSDFNILAETIRPTDQSTTQEPPSEESTVQENPTDQSLQANERVEEMV